MEAVSSPLVLYAFVGTAVLSAAYILCCKRNKSISGDDPVLSLKAETSEVLRNAQKLAVELKGKGEQVGTVSHLYIYPIKSCKGIRLESAELFARGIMHDRQFMVADESGNFYTQRGLPTMALIDVQFSRDFKSLKLTAPGMLPIEVPIQRQGLERIVRVWGDQCVGVDQGEVAAEWLSAYLNKSGLKLVRFADDFVRPTSLSYAPGYQTGFADGFPFLIAAESSLADLNNRCPEHIPMNRFRPNIVVNGSTAWDEDEWDVLQIGKIPMKMVKPCSRCKMPSTNQETGVQTGVEPMETLRSFRTGKHIQYMRSPNEIYFGQNAVHSENGTIKIGDPVMVYSRRPLSEFPPRNKDD
eukprot:GILK01005904.1.p1 GENE.GILK01005904.1~~GILK01005904.1.p1  ORF type:complete len:355 (+),score=34.72 GILK01005904.1:45-1109(+)